MSVAGSQGPQGRVANRLGPSEAAGGLGRGGGRAFHSPSSLRGEERREVFGANGFHCTHSPLSDNPVAVTSPCQLGEVV